MKFNIGSASAALVLLSTKVVAKGPLSRTSLSAASVFTFKNLKPSTQLNWTPCFDKFTCTVLEVPLDYANPSLGTTVVPFIKRASNNTNAEDVLINPGGPGASGVNLVLTPELSNYFFDTVFQGQYNLVSFDPRGVNNSDIDLNICNQDEESNDPVDDDVLQETWTSLRRWSRSCTNKQLGKTSKYATTVGVATDMLRYTEARAQALGQSVDQSKLWFYGASYGTVLGATFASMYPQRVARMVLDGVVDSDDYYNGQALTTLVDTDKAVKMFFETCYTAGPKCAFGGKGTVSSASDLERAFKDLGKRITAVPLAIPYRVSESRDQLYVDWSSVRQILFMGLYSPVSDFPDLAKMLKDLQNGQTQSYMTKLKALLSDDETANAQITCNDANGRFSLPTFQDFKQYVQYFVDQSFYAGNLSFGGATCQDYDIKPPQSQVFNGTVTSASTNSPLLFIGTTADPVTPLKSAWKMSAQFNGSAVLVVDGTGHTSIAAKSNCTVQYIQDYLANNTLPPIHSVCKSEETPFLTAADRGTSIQDAKEGRKGAASVVMSSRSLLLLQLLVMVAWIYIW